MSDYTSTSVEETQKIAADIAEQLVAGDLLCLYGDLGAGKTTFSQGLLTALGFVGPFPSPTFTIVNEYKRSDFEGGKDTQIMTGITHVYHVDAYRISAEDVENIGWHDLIADSFGIVILEWPERIADAIPAHAKKIFFTTAGEETRTLRLENF